MADELSSQQKMSRFASPLIGERSPKRTRTSTEPQGTEKPKNVIDIVEGGDVLLVVNDLFSTLDTPVGLRVSSFALSMASPVFKAQLATASKREGDSATVLQLPETSNGDATLILCNILHLRNDKLPARLTADMLLELTLLADNYGCTVAVGRSTTQWFDALYHQNNAHHIDLAKIVEAAYILDEAVYFARFTSRWVLNTFVLKPQIPMMHTTATQKLAIMLLTQQTNSSIRLRMDLDSLVDIAARCFSREFRHYIDWAPEMSPDASETPSGKPPTRCRVDGDGGQEFLGALREAYIWPSEVWFRVGDDNKRMIDEEADQVSIGDIVQRLADFVLPDYDDVDQCEFCDGIKKEFAEALKDTKQAQKTRLWGLCLDCFKTSGAFNPGECRFEHKKGEEKKAKRPLAIQGANQGGTAAQMNGETQSAQQIGGGLGMEGTNGQGAPAPAQRGGLGIEGL